MSNGIMSSNCASPNGLSSGTEHLRDGSLLKKKQEEWDMDNAFPETWFPFGTPGGGAPNRKYEAINSQLDGREMVDEDKKNAERTHDLIEKLQDKLKSQKKEIEEGVDEDKKNAERSHDVIEKLQNKLKSQKKEIEEGEDLANVNLQKFRQIQHQLDDAEERADHAEDSMLKMRAESRSGTTAPPDVQKSQFPAVLRSSPRSAFR